MRSQCEFQVSKSTRTWDKKRPAPSCVVLSRMATAPFVAWSIWVGAPLHFCSTFFVFSSTWAWFGKNDQILEHVQFELEHLCISAQLFLCSVVHEGDFFCSGKVPCHAETLFARSNLGLRPRFSLASLEKSKISKIPKNSEKFRKIPGDLGDLKGLEKAYKVISRRFRRFFT